MRLIGIKRVNYISKSSGNPVSGWNLYLTYSLKDNENEQGLGTMREFIAEAAMEIPLWDYIGSDVELIYNKYGRVTYIRKEGGLL